MPISIEERLAILETQLRERADSQQKRLEERAAEVNGRFDRLQARIDAMDKALQAKIDTCHPHKNGTVRIAGGSAFIGGVIASALITLGKALGWF